MLMNVCPTKKSLVVGCHLTKKILEIPLIFLLTSYFRRIYNYKIVLL